MAITLDEYISALFSTDFVSEGNIMMEKAVTINGAVLLSDIKLRISERGEMSSETPLAPYSSNAHYYQRKDFANTSSFTPKGKDGKVKGAKTMYLAGGYRELRSIQGLRTDITNLRYRNNLMNSFVIEDNKIGFNNFEQANKKDALEEQYGGEIFNGSLAELKKYDDNVQEYAAINSPLNKIK